MRPAPHAPALALAALAALAALLGPAPGVAQTGPDPEGQPAAVNPFEGFETHRLANGVRIWFRRLEGASDVTVGAFVPYGWDQDPRGTEEVAHFTEHVLFGDHAGRTEEQILDEVEARGGQRNGITSPDHTFYYVRLPAEHGLYGVGWLGRVLEPKSMDPVVVERNRQPVALEIGARPRQFFDHLEALLDPAFLRAPEYWEREFGLETRAARVYDRYAALQRIGPEDLRAFYDRYYTPAALTVVVVGDVARTDALAAVDSAFGGLPPRPVPDRYGPLRDPGRRFQSVTWAVRPNVRYQRVFKVYELDAREHLRLLFLARYLDRRLSMRLRFGEMKAVYSVQLQVVQRGPAAHLLLAAPVDPPRFDDALAVIEEELDRLATGTVPPAEFEEDRTAVVERVKADNRESRDLVFWAQNAFYDPAVHADFPDVAGAFASMTPSELAALVGERLTADRQGVWIGRPQPLSQGVLLVGGLLLALLTLRLTARGLIRPVDMTRLRYVARIKASAPWLAVLACAYLGVGMVAARLLVAAGERAAYRWVLPVDVYPYQMAIFVLTGMAALALVVGYLSLPPRKLLLFDDHLRVKHLAFRSRRLDFDGLRVSRASWLDVARGGAAFRTVPLSLGLFGSGVWIHPARGPGYLVRVRAPDELVAMVERARGSSAHPASSPAP